MSVSTLINARELRARLPEIVRRVRRGSRFTVLYRSQAAFDIRPVDDFHADRSSLTTDPLYKAPPLGKSSAGDIAARHDEVLYR